MTSFFSVIACLFLGLSILSVWIRRDVRIWGGLLGLSLLSGLIGRNIFLTGLIITILWAVLWFIYAKKKKAVSQFALFLILILFSFGFKFHRLPGFGSLWFTSHFRIGFETPLLGLFPLALLVPLAITAQDWKKVLRGLLIGCVGIAILAIAAIASGVVHWQLKFPSFATSRYLNNLIFIAIPEEAFYRGFVQNELIRYLKKMKGAKWMSLILTSIIFTLAHVYWAPSMAILGFVFLASLLYGGVYLISGKIESAILCHFLLNFIHMTFFSYHAL